MWCRKTVPPDRLGRECLDGRGEGGERRPRAGRAGGSRRLRSRRGRGVFVIEQPKQRGAGVMDGVQAPPLPRLAAGRGEDRIARRPALDIEDLADVRVRQVERGGAGLGDRREGVRHREVVVPPAPALDDGPALPEFVGQVGADGPQPLHPVPVVVVQHEHVRRDAVSDARPPILDRPPHPHEVFVADARVEPALRRVLPVGERQRLVALLRAGAQGLLAGGVDGEHAVPAARVGERGVAETGCRGAVRR